MGKFRSKLKGQTKGKRWPKGQSSSSNPETRKYRDLAKSRFFQENLGPSNLTSDALRKHDAVSTTSYVSPDIPTDMSETESETSTYKTMQSFASDWSECSNISFSRLIHGFQPDSALHKEMLAVLAAVTEVIKQNGGGETSTEYFAVLMTTAEVTEPEMSLAAVLGLLGMVVRSVPRPVLRMQFASAARLFLGLLERNAEGENGHILKSLLGLLAALLRALELAAWSEPNTLQMLGTVLAFTCHLKPKVRRAAQKEVCAVLQASCFMLVDEQPPAHHPAAGHVANFCIGQLEASPGQSAKLHTLTLLGAVVAYLPAASLRRAVERVLALLAGPGGDALVSTCALRVLHALCSSQSPTALAAPQAARLVTALLELQPQPNDVSSTQAWLTTLSVALVYLSDLDRSLALASLPRAVVAFTELWLSERAAVMTAATHALHTLLEDCVGPTTIAPESLDRVYTTLRSCLGYQYHKAWHLVLHVHATAFRCAPRDAAPRLVGPTLQHLAELRDSYKFSYNNELEFAVGAAIKALGPDMVLQVIRLKHEDGSVNLDRSWLLPVLKENVQCSTLEYFAREILPLAAVCERQARHLSQNNDSISAHSFELLGVQLWSLLPSFCRHATDVPKSFRHLAKTLGSAISDRKELRLFVMSALRKLIQHAKEKEEEEEEEEDKTELGRFAKNYLPILFNVYTTKAVGSDEEGQRLAALDTVREYLNIAPNELTKQLFDNAVNSLRNTTDDFTRESLLDLVRCLSVHQSTESLGPLYAECIQPGLEATNKKEQKKAYRLLEEICNSTTPGCLNFVRSHRKQISGLVARGLGAAASCSRAARLRVQWALLRATPQLHHDSRFLKAAVPEAVLCLSEASSRARAAAQGLLLGVAEALEPRGELPQLIALLLAGLAGPPNLVSATVTALALLTQHHASALGLETVKLLVDAVTKLTTSETRDVVASCLMYFKVYITAIQTPIVAQNLPDIMRAITSMTEDCSKHFRLRVRDILDKLIRKFGIQAVSIHVSPTDTTMLKRLRNLRKMNERKKRRRNEETEDNDNNDEDDKQEEFIVKSTSKTMQDILADSDDDSEDEIIESKHKHKLKKTWIQEDEDDILDFTDPSAIGKITATRPPGCCSNPTKEVKQTTERGFKTSSDGRLIIQDLGGDSDDDSDADESNASETEAETAVLGPPAPGKRKRTDTDSVHSAAPAMKYKAGGSGIHRPISGLVDPYAYLPLQRKLLNKRRRPGGASASAFKQLLLKSKNKKTRLKKDKKTRT